MPVSAKQFGISYREALKIGPERFCKEHLFPFMRAEQGNGFGMDMWIGRYPVGTVVFCDAVGRKSCGSVHCVGGSMQLILGTCNEISLGNVLGLDSDSTDALFYHWEDDRDLAWPPACRKAFAEATTPAQKERIAEQVILCAIRTKGACFRPDYKKE